MNLRLHLRDCIDVMKEMDENSIDAVVCDPPYGISFMNKEFDKLGEGPAQQEWHRRWAVEVRRVLKPGGHLLAFGSSRCFHRLASGIEDAQLEIRDSLFWCYGNGMPKSTAYLKPAHEPIIMARKKPVGSLKKTIQQYGTGGLNIESCRVPFASDADEAESKNKNRHGDFDSQPSNHGIYSPYAKTGAERGNYDPPGRWPTNVLLSHSVDCGETCSPDCPAFLIDSQAVNPITGAGASRFYNKFSPVLYVPKASKLERSEGLVERNSHPCVKPVDLMAHLCRLVTPAQGIVLDPFMGSGSTGIAAVNEGYSFVGIELDPEYFQIAQSRIRAAQEKQCEV